MIGKEAILRDINKFFDEYERLTELCEEGIKEPSKHVKENYIKYYNMSKALVDLDDVVEYKLLPHIPTEETKK